MAPRELEGQLTNLIREFLLTLRSLIDWYLERLDREPQEPRSRTSRSTRASAGRQHSDSRVLSPSVLAQARCPSRPPSGKCGRWPPASWRIRLQSRRTCFGWRCATLLALAAVVAAVVEAQLLAAVAGDQQPAVVARAHVGVVGGRPVAALPARLPAVEERREVRAVHAARLVDAQHREHGRADVVGGGVVACSSCPSPSRRDGASPSARGSAPGASPSSACPPSRARPAARRGRSPAPRACCRRGRGSPAGRGSARATRPRA